MQYHYKNRYSRKKSELTADFNPIDELLFKERKGKFLTHEEKKRIKKYAEEQRKKNLKK